MRGILISHNRSSEGCLFTLLSSRPPSTPPTTKLQDHVRSLAALTANVKRHGAPFRHMLFYGPPGTGKTLAAKRLARTSGLDYAILSGGDVAPLEGAAVTQLHQTFDWAERSRKVCVCVKGGKRQGAARGPACARFSPGFPLRAAPRHAARPGSSLRREAEPPQTRAQPES